MPGFKQTQLNAVPSAYWTFDSDRTGLNGNAIVDEQGNQNPLVVNGDDYLLEQTSLNDIEVSDQYSVTLGWQQKIDGGWPECHFECPHSTAFNFPIMGSFSVEFLYYKDVAGVIRQVGEPGYFQDVYTPVISKGSVLDVRIRDGYYGGDADNELIVTVLGRTITIDSSNSIYPVFGKTNHVIVSYKVTQIDVNEYQSRIAVFFNGKLAGENIANHLDSYPVTVTNDTWFIAGNGGINPRTDYATETFKLDQIAIYNYGVTDTQASYHYTKTKHYDTLIKIDAPTHYWRLNELYVPGDKTLYSEIGGYNGTYFGNISHYQPGPDKLVEAHAIKFNDTGNAVVNRLGTYNVYIPLINVANPYSTEFWFKCDSYNRGTLFYCAEDNPNWAGLVIWINSKAGLHSPGNIEVAESSTVSISSRDTDPITSERENWNDGEWHHICVTRQSTEFKLYLDGELNSQGSFLNSEQNDQPSQIHLMNAAPGDFQVLGQMCELAHYTYALQPLQIQNRWLFTTRYRVEGYTLLQGVPVVATVRFYDHISGELIGQVTSNVATGEYKYYPSSNRYLDVLSFIPDNNTTRYRVHGPVKPAEYDDNHLI